jgi:hypothetical protein
MPWCAKDISPGQGGLPPPTNDETGEHCKSNASRRAHDRRALTGEAGNASRRKVIVEGTARSLEWASAWRTQDESGPTFSRVIRTNFGDRMAKIFRENSDSLELYSRKCDEAYGRVEISNYLILWIVPL